MDSRTPLRRCAHLLLLASAALGAACGGGSTSTPPATPAIGAAGGTVTEASGASVVVPPGALGADVTIRIARDSTGAPALPAGLPSAGATYVITPHGGDFAEPVEVRIPAPGVTLQPNQELKLAKAELGGEWVVLGDSQLVDGVLSAKVTSFSFFVPVTITYFLPLAQLAPFAVTAQLDCGAQPCNALLGQATVTYALTTNGGQVPAGCINPVLWLLWSPYDNTISVTEPRRATFDTTGGAHVMQLIAPFSYLYKFMSVLVCRNANYGYDFSNGTSGRIGWKRPPGYPNLAVLSSPAQLDVVDGLDAGLEVVLGGGASRPLTTTNGPDTPSYSAPTGTNRAVVAWQRSDDDGASWASFAESYQNEANPRPVTESVDWRYWSVRHGFTASAADQGVLIRVHACYTPPDVPAVPCVTGPATRLNVLQQSALPRIVDAPRSVLVTAGQVATFTATAGGAPAPMLQWQTRAANDTGAWADVATGTGGTTGSYATAALSLADNGRQYRVVAANALGRAESAAVTVSVSDLDVAPAISTQPSSLSVAEGSDAAFAVAAAGTEVLSYQWRLDGTPIAGATGPVLRLSAVGAGSAGAYTVVVSNAAGAVASDPAILTVSPGGSAPVAPTIVTQPAAVSVHAGDTATFAVGVSGSGPLSFAWRKGGVAIAGATSAAAQRCLAWPPGDAGLYSVVVGNAAGSVTSADAVARGDGRPRRPCVTPPIDHARSRPRWWWRRARRPRWRWPPAAADRSATSGRSTGRRWPGRPARC